jgi:hypothetical protein
MQAAIPDVVAMRCPSGVPNAKVRLPVFVCVIDPENETLREPATTSRQKILDQAIDGVTKIVGKGLLVLDVCHYQTSNTGRPGLPAEIHCR